MVLNEFQCLIFLAIQVADEIWVCEKQKATKWEGDIQDYKNELIKKMEKSNEKEKKLLNIRK